MSALTDGIDWGTELPDATVEYYFVPAGETRLTAVGSVTSVAWTDYEIEQFELAFDTFETYTNLTFQATTDPAAADLTLIAYSDPTSGTQGGTAPPGTLGAGIAAFNVDGEGWTRQGLEQGGLGFVTILHELGHGLGLAHPHDGGGSSTVFPGVTEAFGDTGDYGLNQGIYTVMSYNYGWPAGPQGDPWSVGYGYTGTPMAIDIAVLQAKYGANMDYNTGDDVYVLPASNKAGTFYSCIWDAGGVDTISAGAAVDCVIDLNDATLEVEAGGGGFVSYADGVHGGFTIANGVVIENAVGGNGDDVLVGNEVANLLSGGAGDDALAGEAGADTLDGGDGSDAASYAGSSGAVRISLADGTASLGDAEGDILTSIENVTGSAFDDSLTGDAVANRLFGGDGSDVVLGQGGDDTIAGEAGSDILIGGGGADVYAASDGGGFELIVGFSSGEDVLDLSLVEEVADFDDLVLVDTGPAVLISYGSGFLLLSETSLGSVEDTDFVFA